MSFRQPTAMASGWGRNLGSSLPWESGPDPELARPSGTTALGTAAGLAPQAAMRAEVALQLIAGPLWVNLIWGRKSWLLSNS